MRHSPCTYELLREIVELLDPEQLYRDSKVVDAERIGRARGIARVLAERLERESTEILRELENA